MKRIALAIVAAALAASQAHAECKVAHVDVPVTMQGLRPVVSGKISGEPVTLLLDSGAFFSNLNPDLVARLKLKAVREGFTGSSISAARAVDTSGVAGKTVTSRLVNAPSFNFAGGEFSNVQFLTTTNLGGGVSGLLGQNLLHAADVDYDLKNGMLRLVKPSGCGGLSLAYWVEPGAGYSVTPLERDELNQWTITTVEINGKKMRAMFDTGASTTFITARAAARAGVKTTDPEVVPAGTAYGIDRAPVKTWVGRFATIKIGDEEIKNGKLSIGDADVDDAYDLLIGADFFLAHHVYVANSQDKMYFTYNGGPVFRAAELAGARAAAAAEARN